MRLLSIDQSLNSTGVVIWYDGNAAAWSILRPETTAEAILKIRWVVKEIGLLIHQHGVEGIVVESLPFGMNSTSVRPLAALYYFIHNLCVEKGIPFYDANITSVKKYATGSGKAKKQDMITAFEVDNPALFDHIKKANIKKTTGLADLADAYFIGKYHNAKTT